MKIGLMGLEFVSPNKGCEALTYSIINILNEFNLEENLEPVCFLVCGYPSEEAHPSRMHNSRKDIGEIVKSI